MCLKSIWKCIRMKKFSIPRPSPGCIITMLIFGSPLFLMLLYRRKILPPFYRPHKVHYSHILYPTLAVSILFLGISFGTYVNIFRATDLSKLVLRPTRPTTTTAAPPPTVLVPQVKPPALLLTYRNLDVTEMKSGKLRTRARKTVHSWDISRHMLGVKSINRKARPPRPPEFSYFGREGMKGRYLPLPADPLPNTPLFQRGLRCPDGKNPKTLEEAAAEPALEMESFRMRIWLDAEVNAKWKNRCQDDRCYIDWDRHDIVCTGTRPRALLWPALLVLSVFLVF